MPDETHEDVAARAAEPALAALRALDDVLIVAGDRDEKLDRLRQPGPTEDALREQFPAIPRRRSS